MRNTVVRLIRLAGLTAPLMLLAGCVSFGSKPPPSLLVLTPTAAAPAGTMEHGDSRQAVEMGDFDAPQKLDVLRVPVQVTGSSIAYLKDAQWVDKPARLMRALIGETIRAKNGQLVIDGESPGTPYSVQLTGVLRDFGYDAGSSTVVAVLDVTKSGATASDPVTTRRFEARIPGVEAKAGPVGRALDEAANQIAGEVADWVKPG
ncbi:ABC transporter [Porphyrobacter algicida]|uniref:ABC transporter n=1 Tax=Qipengyuania algicida TaxID=1836209 RepID=A0A845AD40_9SPHN|nr:ABC-type transport auxiliary lipoprotein family protein [Qipengyuania algicida]MXP27594.1 ABC transporter [Qipengyuania algicida]